MTDQQPPQRQQPPGSSGNDYDPNCPPPPPPPPPACPDPCAEPPKWGPPEIRKECCTNDHDCCGDGPTCCGWFDVDDPCVRAASADCGGEWTQITCTCTSSNEKCGCDDWDCGGYPRPTCVPCKPCEGLTPGDTPTPGDGGGGDGTCSDQLRRDLGALQKDIATQKAEQAARQAKIEADNKRQGELADLIGKFDGFVATYRTARPALLCREDCLSRFYRDTSKAFEKLSADCLKQLQAAINAELCAVEKVKCCQKNLESKLSTTTRLLWEKQEADRKLAKVEDGFKNIKAFDVWLGARFGKLEALVKDITPLLSDKDPQKLNSAFYLFYWKFVPLLCGCFPVAICCTDKNAPTDGGTTTDPKDYGKSTSRGGDGGTNPAPKSPHLGCGPGDWRPSVIDDETLRQLLCCAWYEVLKKRDEAQQRNGAVEAVKASLEYIKTQVPKDDAVDEKVKGRVEKIKCATAVTGPTAR
jgi:hypothetical protein